VPCWTLVIRQYVSSWHFVQYRWLHLQIFQHILRVFCCLPIFIVPSSSGLLSFVLYLARFGTGLCPSRRRGLLLVVSVERCGVSCVDRASYSLSSSTRPLTCHLCTCFIPAGRAPAACDFASSCGRSVYGWHYSASRCLWSPAPAYSTQGVSDRFCIDIKQLTDLATIRTMSALCVARTSSWVIVQRRHHGCGHYCRDHAWVTTRGFGCSVFCSTCSVQSSTFDFHHFRIFFRLLTSDRIGFDVMCMQRTLGHQ